jgi:hypothetical protein
MKETQTKTKKSSRYLAVPMARVMPSGRILSLSAEAMRILGGAKRLVFYHLGGGRTVIEAAGKTASTLFQRLTKKEPVTRAVRCFTLVLQNRTGITRVPFWAMAKDPAAREGAAAPFVGAAIKGFEALYFDFSSPLETATLALDQVVELGSEDGKATQVALAISYEEVLSTRHWPVEGAEKRPPKVKAQKAAKKAAAPKAVAKAVVVKKVAPKAKEAPKQAAPKISTVTRIAPPRASTPPVTVVEEPLFAEDGLSPDTEIVEAEETPGNGEGIEEVPEYIEDEPLATPMEASAARPPARTRSPLRRT